VKTVFHIAVLIIVGAFLGGCPSVWNAVQAPKESSADDLYQRAEQEYKNGQFTEAVESYERLKSGHPEFKKMPTVCVKIGDGLYAAGDYDRAISRYQQFLELYPTHRFVPRVKYYIALSYFSQIKKTDLDNALIKRAEQCFAELAADPKGGDWAKKAEEKQRDCKRMLAEKEFDKAHTYYKMGNYAAARVAAKRVLEEYPNLGFDDQAKNIVDRVKAE
jgi:outer membrane protein assembly factor BamD